MTRSTAIEAAARRVLDARWPHEGHLESALQALRAALDQPEGSPSSAVNDAGIQERTPPPGRPPVVDAPATGGPSLVLGAVALHKYVGSSPDGLGRWAERPGEAPNTFWREYRALPLATYLAVERVVEAAQLRRNTRLFNTHELAGEWCAVPAADFDELRAAVAALKEVKRG